MTTVFESKLREIADKTFEITCYMFLLDDREAVEPGMDDLEDGSITAMVDFSGATRGALVIRVSPDLLDAMAENMLGMEETDQGLKEGALCEVANIICGNIVPFFARNEKICYIGSPGIIEDHNQPGAEFDLMNKEHIQLNLDEGVAQISIYYLAGDDDD